MSDMPTSGNREKIKAVRQLYSALSLDDQHTTVLLLVGDLVSGVLHAERLRCAEPLENAKRKAITINADYPLAASLRDCLDVILVRGDGTPSLKGKVDDGEAAVIG